MSFPRYPKYKASGVEWLGEVPEHWDTRRIRTLFEIKKRIAGNLGFDVFSVTQNGIKVKDIESNEGQLSMDYSKYQLVEVGDFAMNLMDLITGGADIAMSRGVTSPDYRVCSLRDPAVFHDRYFIYLFQKMYREKIFFHLGQGSSQLGRWRLPRDEFNNFIFPAPSYPEQTHIAAFLDRETAKIDALVSEQRRLIELLKEKRQAVISHAVTQGLNPHAPMKPSGIEWLGDVPKHWEVGALGYFATIGTGSTPDRTVQDYWNGDVPWVKTGEINYATITTTDEGISPEGLASCSLTMYPAGTMLMALYGQGVTRGRVALLGIPSTCNQACAAIQVDDRIDRHFLQAFFVFAYPFIRGIGNETTQMNMNLEFIRRIRVVVPPVQEQTEIAGCIQTETAKLDTLTAEAQRAIDLLQERRTALISAAVTGQIDVQKETT